MLTTTHTSELLSVKEVAARLRLHPMTVRRKIESGELPAFQLGGPGTSVRISAGELDAWLEQRSTSGSGSLVDTVSGSALGRGSFVGTPAERDESSARPARQSSSSQLAGDER
jgi:excisionase family DNA binding protein